VGVAVAPLARRGHKADPERPPVGFVANCPRGLQVDNQFEMGRLLDWDFWRFSAAQKYIGDDSSLTQDCRRYVSPLM
jgi:hypothetical protein